MDMEQAGSIFVVFRDTAAPARRSDRRNCVRCRIAQGAQAGNSQGGLRGLETAKWREGRRDREAVERAKGGQLEVTADNDLAGDPAYNVVKQLQVDYVLDGVAKSITVDENQVLRLPPEELLGVPPPPRLSLENGQLR